MFVVIAGIFLAMCATRFIVPLVLPGQPVPFHNALWLLPWQLLFVALQTSVLDMSVILTPHTTFNGLVYERTLEGVYAGAFAFWGAVVLEFCWFYEHQPRKDRKVMIVHHVCTVALIAGSYARGIKRYGVATMFFHDASDLFLQLLKIAWRLRAPNFVIKGIFAPLIGSWVALRLVLFGHLIWSFILPFPCMFCEGVGLGILYLMNWFWFGLLLKAAMQKPKNLEDYYEKGSA